jgi:hypothetical protein
VVWLGFGSYQGHSVDNLMSIDVAALLSFLEELNPKNVYRIPYVSAGLSKCGLEVRDMIKGNGIIINGRRVEVAQPEWGEPGIYSLHILATVYEIITGRAPRSNMEGRGFWYRDVLGQLKSFHSEDQTDPEVNAG